MAGIESWSTTAASNNAAVPNGWPEGMAPSSVNDAARQGMASVRTWYETAEWINLGYTHTYVASTQFKISGSNVTAIYPVGRRVKAVGSSTGTIYGLITVSSFSTDTTLTVVWDSGSLSNETLTIYVGILNPSTHSHPTVVDSRPIICNASDRTKKIAFDATNVTTGTTATYTMPSASTSLVGTTTTDTLTNKTLTTPIISGITSGASTSAGNVGEVITSTVTGVSISSGGGGANVTSISLTAGKWLIMGGVRFDPAATTSITRFYGGASTTINTVPFTSADSFSAITAAYVPGAIIVLHPIPVHTVNVSGTTTYYLNVGSSFTVSTMTAGGTLTAIRIQG